MNRLAFFKKFTFTLIFAMVGVISWGQTLTWQNPSAPYSSTNPYVISSSDDWHKFVTDVNGGYSYEGKIVKLTNNISVTEMVGEGINYFSGTFDGNKKTLTVALSSTSEFAPFYYTEGATIENLTVTGTIIASAGYAAGLIYSNAQDFITTRRTQVNNVTVSVDITDGNDDSAGIYCAGFACYSFGLDFNNCVYNGKIKAGNFSGGFSASYDYGGYYNGPANFADCIFDPADGSSISSGYTFAKNIVSYATCYYTSLANTTAQGQIAYKTTDDIPANVIAKKVPVNNTTVYGKVNVSISGINNVYLYTGSSISVTPVINFDGSEPSTDYYNATFTPATIQECGEYTYTVKGNNSSNYYGSVSREFYVVKENFTGEGTAESPYQIANAGDWYSLAYKVNNGNSFSGKYFLLTNDIVVSTMVGTEAHPFKGHFSGRVGETYTLRTLTFNYGTSDAHTDEEIVAPFRYTNGATIEYLKV